MIFGTLLIGIGLLLCVVFPNYKGIVLSLIILVDVIFSKYQKLPGSTDWFWKDKLKNKKIMKLFKLVLFIIGLASLIYFVYHLYN